MDWDYDGIGRGFVTFAVFFRTWLAWEIFFFAVRTSGWGGEGQGQAGVSTDKLGYPLDPPTTLDAMQHETIPDAIR